MNINPHAKRILCFGDSNTYGTVPYASGGGDKKRYSTLERWTGIAQQKLGNDYEIIEEGRGGRTIDISLGDGTDITKIGSLFLEGLLHSHGPLDLVIVMLGTNDIKPHYNLTPELIAQHMEEKIISLVNKFGYKLLLISPPSIIDTSHAGFPGGSHEKIEKVNILYKDLAKKYSLQYLDIQDQLVCGSDGIHLTLASHELLGTSIAEKIKEII